MTHDLWTAVDHYIEDLFIGQDEALAAALADSAAAGLPAISVSPSQGRLLEILARAVGARRVLEIGTLGGYSGIWMARALPPDGRLITLEMDESHAAVARRNFDRAGVGERVEIRIGKALDLLPQLVAESAAPFDLVFIDADKTEYPQYLDWSIRLTRPGSLIVADNVVREGGILDADSNQPAVQGTRRFLAAAAANPRITATAIQTVGSKKHDGLAFLTVLDPKSPRP